MSAGGVHTLRDLELEDRQVFLRLDLNVPLRDGVITSDARIRAALPTLERIRSAGARLTVASHLGRPKGQRNAKFSLEPVAAHLSGLLDTEVLLADDCIGDGVKTLARELKAGGVLLLENLRFQAGETDNDPNFARQLGAHCEVYVNDAFGASHRSHASIVGMVGRFEQRACGLLLEREVQALSKLLDDPARPFVAVVGGAKVADKLGVLEALLPRVDVLCVGGAMAYTFLRARDVAVGASRFEENQLSVARNLLKRAVGREIPVVLPSDHVVAKHFSQAAEPIIVSQPEIPEKHMGLDIGPETRKVIADRVRKASTVFWNGPMGVFEWEAFAKGTMAVARAVAECEGYTVVGGGDSVAALEVAELSGQVGHVSTGGGASLEFMEHGTLPGLEVLRTPGV